MLWIGLVRLVWKALNRLIFSFLVSDIIIIHKMSGMRGPDIYVSSHVFECVYTPGMATPP